MTRDRIRMLAWSLAILVPATIAMAAGMNSNPSSKEVEGTWECSPIQPQATPAGIQA